MAIEKIVNIKVDTNSATKSVDNLAKATNNLDASFDEVYKDLKPLTARMGEAEDRLYELANAGQTATAEYQGLLQKVGEYRKVQIQTDLAVDAASTTLASKLGGALNTVAGGFSLAQGAASLMGSESQNLEKAILKVQSAMAISQGIETINESRKSVVALGNSLKATALYQKALSAATAVQTFVMNGATLAAKALRGALIATGVGALVVGVGLLIANFEKVKKVVMNLVPGLSAVGDVVMSIVNTVTDFVGITSEAERTLDKMVSESQKTLRKNQDFLDTQGDKYDEYTKRKIQANIDYAAKVKEVAEDETRTEAEKIKYLKDLRAKADRDILQADKDRQAEKDKKAKEEQDKLKEAEAKRKEKEKEAAQKAKEAREKELAERNDFLYKINQAEIEQRILEKEQSDERIIEIENEFAKIEQAEIISAEKRAEDLIKFEENKNKVLASSKENLNNIISGLENTGIAKTKAGQTVSKAIALTQIGIDSAVAISKASTLANAEGVAAQLAFPLIPGAGTIARVTSYASTALSVASNIARAKQLLSSGGSSGGGSMPSGSSSAPTPPQFNIVGQSGTNQLAQTIAGQQNKPIEAFVVSSAVTTSQALDRNRVKTATFGA